MSARAVPVPDVAAALAVCRERDAGEQGIEMFVALESPRGVPGGQPREADAKLAALATAYARALSGDDSEPGLEQVAQALEVLAAHHFELGT